VCAHTPPSHLKLDQHQKLNTTTKKNKSRSGDAAAGPAAAGRAARVAAKRRERDALSAALEQLRARGDRLRAAAERERTGALALARECEAVGRQVAEVFEAAAA